MDDVRKRHSCYYSIGFNGFGQISNGKDLDVVTQPAIFSSHCQVTPGKSRIYANWSTTAFLNEDGSITIKGFFSGKDEQEIHSKSLNKKDENCSIDCFCFDKDKFYFIDEDGELIICVSENTIEGKAEIFSHSSAADLKFKNISLAGVTGMAYLVTDKRKLFCMKTSEEFVSVPLPGTCAVTGISCGINHCLALTDKGEVLSWGSGSRGQLGHGNLQDEENPRLIDLLCGVEIKAIASGGWHSIALAVTGDVYVWGWNESGQLGFPALEEIHSCSTKFKKKPSQDSNNLNKEKYRDEVHQEAVAMINVPTLLELEHYLKSDKFITVKSISCGTRHSAMVTDEGQVVSWGWAKYGQLGQDCCRESNIESCKEIDTEDFQHKEKRKKLDTSDKKSHKCLEKPHKPGLVNFFSDKNLSVESVHCHHWNTFFEVVKSS